VARNPWTVFFDVGPIGPDYQPGHAHADTLTLETSFSGRRLFVDPGTYAYDDARRRYDRSTDAHNTVCIDARDTSEVWHIFRVGRRAYAHHVSVEFNADGFTAGAAHDGYASLPGGPKHARTVSITNQRELRITDRVDGRGTHSLSGGWLLAPGWSAEAAPGGWRVSRDGQGVSVNVKGPAETKLGLERRPYHPEYGLEIETVRLCWILESSRLPAEIARSSNETGFPHTHSLHLPVLAGTAALALIQPFPAPEPPLYAPGITPFVPLDGPPIGPNRQGATYSVA